MLLRISQEHFIVIKAFSPANFREIGEDMSFDISISVWGLILVALLCVVIVLVRVRRSYAWRHVVTPAASNQKIGEVFDWVRRVGMSKATSGIFDIEDPPENWFTEVNLAPHQHDMLKSARNRLDQARGELALFEYDLDILLQVASEQPTEQERCVALAEYLRYACQAGYVAEYARQKRGDELTAVRSELTTLAKAQMDEMVAAASVDREKFLLVLFPFIDSYDQRDDIVPYSFDDYVSLGVGLSMPEEWADLVARYIYAPSVDLFYAETDHSKINPAVIRLFAAGALRTRDLTAAKLALAYCDVEYIDQDADEIVAIYRDAIGPVMMMQLALLVSELHDELGLNFDNIESDPDEGSSDDAEPAR